MESFVHPKLSSEKPSNEVLVTPHPVRQFHAIRRHISRGSCPNLVQLPFHLNPSTSSAAETSLKSPLSDPERMRPANGEIHIGLSRSVLNEAHVDVEDGALGVLILRMYAHSSHAVSCPSQPASGSASPLVFAAQLCEAWLRPSRETTRG